MLSHPSFCKMDEPLNKSMDIVHNHRPDMRESVMRLGMLTKNATYIEMMEKELGLTTDHQTGTNNETFSTVTNHFITE